MRIQDNENCVTFRKRAQQTRCCGKREWGGGDRK